MMQLYWSPRSRSFSALWLMEETGQPYERVLTDITTGAQKRVEYLAINPMGKVPALKDGEATLAESAAICAYVAERYPQAKLAPPLGDPLRAKYLYWLFFSPGCIEPAMSDRNQNGDEPRGRRLGRFPARDRRARQRA
jgi:glutathione S-transferase